MRVAYASPRQVCDVYQTVYAAQVNEYAIGSDILNSSFKNLSFLKFADDFFLLLFQFGFDECFVGNYYVSELLVNLYNLKFHCLSDEYVVVANGFHVNLRTRQECFDAEYVYNHTALRAALDVALDYLVVLQGCVDAVPRTSSACFAV